MGEGISNGSRKQMGCGMVWGSLWRWGWANEGVVVVGVGAIRINNLLYIADYKRDPTISRSAQL